jgi:hypothetical protein
MKVRRSLYAAFLLWPVGAGMLFAGLVPFVFGESGPTRLLSLVFIIIGMSFNGLWAFGQMHPAKPRQARKVRLTFSLNLKRKFC